MPRQGNGSYVAPAGQPVVNDTIIESGVENLLVSDLAYALTTSIATDGQTVPTADLPMGSHKHTFVADANRIDNYGSAGQIQRADLIKLTAPGYSGGVYSGTLAMGQTTFVQNQMVLATFANANGGPSALIVNGGAQWPILRGDGVSQLSAGDILANCPIVLMWSNVFTAWLIVTGPGAAGNIVPDNTYLRLDGGNTMIGPVHLSGLPITQPNEAASKSYVDLVAGGGTITGVVRSITTSDINVLTAAAVDGLGNVALTTYTNVPNGLLKLDANGHVPLTLVDIASVTFLGVWPGGGANPAVPGGPTNVLNYYIVNPGGNLTLYDWTGSAYVNHVVAVQPGDNIIYNFTASAGTPVGWYYLPRTVTALGSNVIITPTPSFPSANTVQLWVNAADPAIQARLPLVGGTMTGPLTLAAAPVSNLQAATKKYVDDQIVVAGGVASFNTRVGAVTLLGSDVNTALGYTPANGTSQTFTGNVQAANLTVAAGGVLVTDRVNLRAKTYLAQTGVLAIDAHDQTQLWNLTGAVTISSINNLTAGNIVRIEVETNTFNITWPSTVKWPLGVVPNLSAGPQLEAIIVIELDRLGNMLASATMY